jgi:hypothetical protein
MRVVNDVDTIIKRWVKKTDTCWIWTGDLVHNTK